MSGILGGLIGSFATASTSSYDSIATVNVTSNTAAIEFTSIPSTYKHLQIRYLARDNRASTGADDMLMTFNAGASAAYSWHRLVGDGSTIGSAGSASETYISLSAAAISRGNNTSGIFASGVIDILDYANTNKYKTTEHYLDTMRTVQVELFLVLVFGLGQLMQLQVLSSPQKEQILLFSIHHSRSTELRGNGQWQQVQLTHR